MIYVSLDTSIPPSVCKRVKQAPESKREAHLTKELEEILEREGLSTDPSEKGTHLWFFVRITFRYIYI